MRRIPGPTVIDPRRGSARAGLDSMSSTVAWTVQAESIDVELDGHPVLRDLSMVVAWGEVVGVTGRNRSGKSTLLRVLATLVVPVRGRLRLLGETLTGARMLLPEQRGHLALVGHRPALHPHRTVAEELALVCSIRAAAGWPSRRRGGLEMVGLSRTAT